ncbi:MAG: bifunctional diaminohydroxyphosphoribosylaminopyrimidine deaminase/5-amino-6-(5-phosphoribosylamino)uracil reductase RibD [Balneolia bacterium]|nr:bifunctional diaminohydroxyphosphoribosylaminopyrimidine deaminase/5-amino-6-(5-phosphoribosylamino)uracil reductase RibD [Balneolia bacterium]
MPASRFTKDDTKWMKKALRLAELGRGHVSPNPLVGCVIINAEGTKIGQGYHERYGKAHAEVNALTSVKDKSGLEGATVYVTLEPCAHVGKTPSCAVTLSKLPVKRVVVALEDPNPKVNGKGIEILQKAGIEVETGLLSDEATSQNESFLHYTKTGRPFVVMKMAQTLDGYIAAPDGSSQWITGKMARSLVHEWRARYDSVMVGRNTVLNDNPRLTVRHVEGRQPKRIIVDGPLSLPRTMNVFTDQYEDRTIVITHNETKYRQSADPMLNILDPDGFRGQTLLVNKFEGHSDLRQAFSELARLDVASVLVEPGSDLARALLRRGLVDKLELFIAPKLLGGGTRSFVGLGIDSLNEALQLKNITTTQVGDDLLVSAYF